MTLAGIFYRFASPLPEIKNKCHKCLAGGDIYSMIKLSNN